MFEVILDFSKGLQFARVTDYIILRVIKKRGIKENTPK